MYLHKLHKSRLAPLFSFCLGSIWLVCWKKIGDSSKNIQSAVFSSDWAIFQFTI